LDGGLCWKVLGGLTPCASYVNTRECGEKNVPCSGLIVS